MTDVAGDEPIAVEGCFRRRRILPIAGEHVDPTDEDLAVISDPNPYAGQGRPDRTDSGSADDVDARGSGGLGESVSFEDLDAEAAIEVTEARAQRSRARDRVRDAATHRLCDLAVDQPLEKRVLHPESPRHAPVLAGLRVRDGDVGRSPEDLALSAGLRLLLGGIVDLLEHARNGEQERRAEAV